MKNLISKKPTQIGTSERKKIEAIISLFPHPYNLIAKLLYGRGPRLFECMDLRVNNFNLDSGILTAHDGKGKKDRAVPTPETTVIELKTQFQSVIDLHAEDLK